MRSGSPAASAAAARRAATPKPTMPGTFSVPERRPRSCPPPSGWAAAEAAAGAASNIERTDALGPVHLVGGEAHEVDVTGLHVRSASGPPPARRRSGRRPRARGTAHRPPRRAARVPISLFAAISETSIVSGRERFSDLLGIHEPVSADRHHRDREPLALQPAARLEHGRRARALVTTCEPLAAERPRRPPHGEVVGLGGAGGEDDLLRLGPDQLRRAARARPRPPRWASAAKRGTCRRGCRSARRRTAAWPGARPDRPASSRDDRDRCAPRSSG